MNLRPCIDIHNGKVKQIVGKSLTDKGDTASENFVSEKDAVYFAGLYNERNLKGGHIIILNSRDSEYYEASKNTALSALLSYPGLMQAGGGINPENAEEFLSSGASHVIVTSYVFNDGKLNEKNLERMVSAVGRERLVLDLSCRFRNKRYYIVTNRWQSFTDMELTPKLLKELSISCDEFLVHAADVEGEANGIENEVVRIISESPIPVTYAGGIKDIPDIELIGKLGNRKVDFTIGSALSLFGGSLELDEVLNTIK